MKTLVAMATTRSLRLTMGKCCHQHNWVSFDWIFLTLADMVDMDKISDGFENWPDQIIYLSYVPLITEKKNCLTVINITYSVLMGSS